ncbi:MAG: hypothetical protein PVH19_14480, partial [Planctomycetia bacterium]
MWCIRCGQDVPWAASAKDGRLACSRCGMTQEQAAMSESSIISSHVSEASSVNSVHGPHPSSAANHASLPDTFYQDAYREKSDLESGWPVSSAYDGWNLDEQLSHIREALDLLESSKSMIDTSTSVTEPAKIEHRFDTVHSEQHGLHRRSKKNDHSLMGRFIFGLMFLTLGTG